MDFSDSIAIITIIVGLIVYFSKIDPKIRDFVGRELGIKIKTGYRGVWLIKSEKSLTEKALLYVVLFVIKVFTMVCVIGAFAYFGFFLEQLVKTIIHPA